MSQIADLDSFREELTAVEEKYKEITGEEMKKYYRPPQGKFSESNLEQAQTLGYQTIFWSLAYVDWYTDKQPSPEEAYNKLLPASTPAPLCCSTAPPRPTQISWMNCSPNGRIWATPSAPWTN